MVNRKKVYETPEALDEAIAEYITYCDEKKGDGKKGEGKGIYTIAGCALFLGFKSREAMWHYKKASPEFADVMDRFKLFLTSWNEEKLYWLGTIGAAQFWLKNFGGYRDESTVNQNTQVTEVKPTIVNSNIPLASDEKEVE